MEYLLEGVNCFLRISNVRMFENEIDLPSNTLCRVEVSSGDFKGAAEFDLDAKRLGIFSVQLKKMYEILGGSVLLKETYEPSYINIESKPLGHFTVSGKIVLSYPPHSLEFEFDVDQTMIRDFAFKLHKDFSRFAILHM